MDSKQKNYKTQKEKLDLHYHINLFCKKSLQILNECQNLKISEPLINKYCTESLFKLLENKVLLKEALIKEEIYKQLLSFI